MLPFTVGKPSIIDSEFLVKYPVSSRNRFAEGYPSKMGR